MKTTNSTFSNLIRGTKGVMAISLAMIAIMVSTANAVTTLDSGSADFLVSPDNDYQLLYGTTHVDMTVHRKIEVSGTLTNWDSIVNTDNSWAGLWTTIGMLGTDYLVNGSNADAGFTHLGDAAYGDMAHQAGMGQNATFVPYSWSNGDFTPAWEDVQASFGTANGQCNLMAGGFGSTLYFKLNYDLTDLANKTMMLSVSTDNVNWDSTTGSIGLSNAGTPDDYSDTVFAVMAFNNATAADGSTYYRDQGFSITWQVNEVPEPSSVALACSALLGLLTYAWTKRSR